MDSIDFGCVFLEELKLAKEVSILAIDWLRTYRRKLIANVWFTEGSEANPLFLKTFTNVLKLRLGFDTAHNDAGML